jgi:glycosyltransferase involved in cell wall biosynthesis
MKILFNCSLSFALAHGGWSIQIERTASALRQLGLEVEYMRWWDEGQKGDVIHFFGRMPTGQLEFAHQKGIKVVMAELLTAQGSRSRRQLWVQRTISRCLEKIAPRSFIAAFNWDSYRCADACIALTPWEAQLMNSVFGAPEDRVHIVPNGVEDVFLDAPKTSRGPWLICTATLTERKRVWELAAAAARAQTPVWVIGAAYADSDPYAQKFFTLAKEHPKFIRYEGSIQDRGRLAQIYREARGFVLLSTMESLSLSALEAAACQCPLLLSDLPWARSTFGESASYCPITGIQETANSLRKFYDAAPTLPTPPRPASWTEVARQLKTIYEGVLSTSR